MCRDPNLGRSVDIGDRDDKVLSTDPSREYAERFHKAGTLNGAPMIKAFPIVIGLIFAAPLPAFSQSIRDILVVTQIAHPTIDELLVARYLASFDGLPQRNQERAVKNFLRLTDKSRLFLLQIFDAGEGEDDRKNMKLLASTLALVTDVEDLARYSATGKFPPSGQLPNAKTQFDRVSSHFPALSSFFDADFSERMIALQHDAESRYRAHLARKKEELARKKEETARKKEETARKKEETAQKEEELARKEEELARGKEELAALREINRKLETILEAVKPPDN